MVDRLKIKKEKVRQISSGFCIDKTAISRNHLFVSPPVTGTKSAATISPGVVSSVNLLIISDWFGHQSSSVHRR